MINMGLDEVKNEILEKAKKEAKSIIDSAEKEASKITADAKSKAKDFLKFANDEIEKDLQTAERKEIAKANFEVKKQMLDKKQELISKVYDDALEQIKKLDSKKNGQFFGRLLEKSSNQIEVSILYLNKNDKDLAKDYSWFNANIIGGVVAENKEKTVKVDFSYDSILQSAKSKTMSDVVGILFEKSK